MRLLAARAATKHIRKKRRHICGHNIPALSCHRRLAGWTVVVRITDYCGEDYGLLW